MASRKILEVEKLGKQYTLGAGSTVTSSAREALGGLIRSPARAFRHSSPRDSGREFWALRDVSFSLDAGEVLGVIGGNGAGKSTLLKLLSEVTAPTEGQVRIAGRVGSLLEVGTGFHPELSGRENIYLNAALLGMSRNEVTRKFDEIVEFSGVQRFLDTPVKRYSSGMYLRLAFAVAAHLDSDILIVDEVLAVGDAGFQTRCLKKIDEVNRSGRTVLFVSHNLNVVERLSNRILWLADGKVVDESRDVEGVIAGYRDSSEERRSGSGVAAWKPSGQDHVSPYCSPLRVFVGDHNRKLLPLPFPRHQEAFLYVEYQVDEVDRGLSIGFTLHTEEGICVFESFHTDQAERRWPSYRLGINLFRVRLPLELLNEGMYTLQMLGNLGFRQLLFERERSPISLRLEVRGGLSESPYWVQRRPGVAAPVLAWESCDTGVPVLT